MNNTKTFNKCLNDMTQYTYIKKKIKKRSLDSFGRERYEKMQLSVSFCSVNIVTLKQSQGQQNWHKQVKLNWQKWPECNTYLPIHFVTIQRQNSNDLAPTAAKRSPTWRCLPLKAVWLPGLIFSWSNTDYYKDFIISSLPPPPPLFVLSFWVTPL